MKIFLKKTNFFVLSLLVISSCQSSTPGLTAHPAEQQLLLKLTTAVNKQDHTAIQQLFKIPVQKPGVTTAPTIASIMDSYNTQFKKELTLSTSKDLSEQTRSNPYQCLVTMKNILDKITPLITPILNKYNAAANNATTALPSSTTNKDADFIKMHQVIVPYQALKDTVQQAQNDFVMGWIGHITSKKTTLQQTRSK